ncbi:MAG: type III secretion inner membrane ring lipoprotein SctJ [Candidatus Anaerobiospirillum merdipullorum]|uniref:Lipoprotein n=1 Tax=Candidatus Anaerobiospirillum merdipullorum TaxID=2838450 RepID=A0A9E2KLK7_9GAMM|nr:type III secretion inner membrane ring lipoprotein SctJ [Candidatus Anaerobiospirillum merdipullorum]
MLKPAKFAVILACLLALSGCKELLYSNLSEEDANEMLVTLLKRGVDAQKVDSGDESFNIMVEEADLIFSLELIKEHSLPRARFESLGTVFSGQGMIASQTEEQARLAFAISEELANTFSKIDGVLDARVHVVLVHHEQTSGLTTPPSAAVFIRHTKDSPVSGMIASIKDTAAKAVPGLSLDNVSVMTELFQENILAPQVKAPAWYEDPLKLGGGIVAALALLSAVGIVVMRRLGFSIKRQKPEKQASTKA